MTLTSRKFLQSFFVQIVSAVALLLEIIDGGTWVACSSLALGIFSAANVVDKKVGGHG